VKKPAEVRSTSFRTVAVATRTRERGQAEVREETILLSLSVCPIACLGISFSAKKYTHTHATRFQFLSSSLSLHAFLIPVNLVFPILSTLTYEAYESRFIVMAEKIYDFGNAPERLHHLLRHGPMLRASMARFARPSMVTTVVLPERTPSPEPEGMLVKQTPCRRR